MQKDPEAERERIRAQLFGATDIALDAVNSCAIWHNVLAQRDDGEDIREANIKALIAVQALKDARKLLGW